MSSEAAVRPDHHPEIKKIWDQFNALVEKRSDKRGIEIDEMDIVTGAIRPKKSTPWRRPSDLDRIRVNASGSERA